MGDPQIIRWLQMSKIIGIIGSRSRDSDNPDFIIVRNKFLDIAHEGDWI